MRVVVLGVTGMLGHQIFRQLSRQPEFEVFGVGRSIHSELAADRGKLISRIDVRDIANVYSCLEKCRPEAVINCVGLTPRRDSALHPEMLIHLNALLPHQLMRWTEKHGARLIHFSTDCVFDGKMGPYTEESAISARDHYGRTKAEGEVSGAKTLTIRSSIIGPELLHHTELFDWFRSQIGKTVKGYQGALYTGLTTFEMARTVRRILLEQKSLSGLFQIASDPITKYDLLLRIRDIFKLDVDVVPETETRCDRRLSGAKFRAETNIQTPSWTEMLIDLRSQMRPTCIEVTHAI